MSPRSAYLIQLSRHRKPICGSVDKCSNKKKTYKKMIDIRIEYWIELELRLECVYFCVS